MKYNIYLPPEELQKIIRDKKALKRFAKKITKVPETYRSYT